VAERREAQDFELVEQVNSAVLGFERQECRRRTVHQVENARIDIDEHIALHRDAIRHLQLHFYFSFSNEKLIRHTRKFSSAALTRDRADPQLAEHGFYRNEQIFHISRPDIADTTNAKAGIAG